VDVIQDIRTGFGPPRDQGSRPTCLAFALSDTHAFERAPFDVLSAEHLFFHSAQRTPGWAADDAVTVDAGREALKLDGQCAESGWPYLAAIPAPPSQWKPPATARPVFKRSSDVLTPDMGHVVAALASGRPTIVTMLLGERFLMPVNGIVVPGAGDADVDYHAVVAVGHGLLGGVRAILVRNSWGARWGIDGHAWVTEPYMQPRLLNVIMVSNKEMVS
jgi:Papain family cysteine protease